MRILDTCFLASVIKLVGARIGGIVPTIGSTRFRIGDYVDARATAGESVSLEELPLPVAVTEP